LHRSEEESDEMGREFEVERRILDNVSFSRRNRACKLSPFYFVLLETPAKLRVINKLEHMTHQI
jgi:hypothetical protein